MNVLIWHVHGSWTTAFVHGAHRYLIPVVPGRGEDGRGRARTWEWPANAVECTPEQLADERIDVVVLQRPRDEAMLAAWTGRRAGRDVAAVWLEHNAPEGRIESMRHPAADRHCVVHVTHTNRLFWDCGRSPTTVVEHGIVDPGHRYTGELERLAVVSNEPARRNRVVGADLLPSFAAALPIDVFGMGASALRGITPYDDVPQHEMHGQLAKRRAYLHPVRWTSLGLSLIEAMHLGMPVIALATTEVPAAVPARAGFVSNDLRVLCDGIRHLAADPDEAAARGLAARRWAVERYGLARFLADWDAVLADIAR